MRLLGSNILCCFRPSINSNTSGATTSAALSSSSYSSSSSNSTHYHQHTNINNTNPNSASIRLSIASRRHSAIAFITGLNTKCALKDGYDNGEDIEEGEEEREEEEEEEERGTVCNNKEVNDADADADADDGTRDGDGTKDEERKKDICYKKKKKKKRERRRVRIKEGVGVLIYPSLLLTTHAIVPSIASVKNAEICLMLRHHGKGTHSGTSKDNGINTLLRRKFLPHLFFATNADLNLTVVACEYVTPEMQPMGLETCNFNPQTVEVGAKVYIMGYNLNEIRNAKCSVDEGGPPRLTIGSGHVVNNGGTYVEVEARDDWWAEGSPGFDAEGTFAFLVTGGECKNQHVNMRTVTLPTIRTWLEPEWKTSTASKSTPNPKPRRNTNPKTLCKDTCSRPPLTYTPKMSIIRIADVGIPSKKSTNPENDSNNNNNLNTKHSLNPNPNPNNAINLNQSPKPNPDPNHTANHNWDNNLNCNLHQIPKPYHKANPNPDSKHILNPNHTFRRISNPNSSGHSKLNRRPNPESNLNLNHSLNTNPKNSLSLSPRPHHKRFPTIPSLRKKISGMHVADSPPKASPRLLISSRNHIPAPRLPFRPTQTKVARNPNSRYHSNHRPYSTKSHVSSENHTPGKPTVLHQKSRRENKPLQKQFTELNKN